MTKGKQRSDNIQYSAVQYGEVQSSDECVQEKRSNTAMEENE